MKRKRATAVLLILLMVVSLLPALGAGVLAAGTRYEEVDVLSADGDYILAAVKDDSGVYAIAIDGRNTKTVELSVSSASGTARSYIETDDTSVVWAYSASDQSFKNGERNFYPGSSGVATSSSSKRAITYENGCLSFPTSSSGTYYITCTDGTFGTSGDSTAAATFRLFKKAAADPVPVDPPAGESETYQMVNAPQSGEEYLIVSSNSAGSAYALKNPGGTSSGASMGSTAVTIGSDGTVKTADTDVVWVFTANGEGFNLTNGSDYLEGASGQVKIFNPQKYADRYWTYTGNQLKHVGGTNTYILYYSSGFTSSTSSNENKIYLFEKVNESTDPVSVTGVSLNKSSLTLETGGTAVLTATVTPADAADKNVTWSSSDTTVATVADGVVTAVAAGTATITVTTADGGKTATCTVTVTAATEKTTYQMVNAPQSSEEYLIVSSNSAGSAYALKNPGGTSSGASMGSTAVTIGSDGTVKTADTDVVWVFTANGEGFNLTNGSDYLEGASGQVKIFNPQKYADRYWTYTGNQLKHVGGTNTYILYYSSGFTSSTSSNENKIYLFEKVNESTDPVSVTGVSLNKSSLTLETGGTAVLTATVTPADAADKNVTWSSSDTTVATVADGVVTAVAAGTATITVTTVDGGKTATCTVTVTAAEPAPEATVAEFMKLKESSVWLIRVPAGNDKIVTCGGQTMKWSSYYEAHVLTMEAAQQPSAADLVVTMTSGTPTAVGYPTKGNDANGTGKVDMSDVQYIYNLYNGRYASLTAAGGMEKVLGADVDKNGKVDTADATAVLTALREARA